MTKRAFSCAQAEEIGYRAACWGNRRVNSYDDPDYKMAWYRGYDRYCSEIRATIAKYAHPRLEWLKDVELSYARNEFPQVFPFNQEGDDSMSKDANLAYIFASIFSDVITVGCVFDPSPDAKLYTYKALTSQNIAVDDYVVVPGQLVGQQKVVQVKSIGNLNNLEPDAYDGYKWVVGRVDIADYNLIKTKEAVFKERVTELRREARRKEAVSRVAEQVGGVDALQKLLNEMNAGIINPHEQPLAGSDSPGTV